MFTLTQRKVVEGRPGNTVVYASPGSGKTTVLTHHLLRQLEGSRIRPETTLCLTFTQKAARELEERLTQLAPPRLEKSIRHLHVGTFHSQIFKIMMRIQPNIPIILSPMEQYRMIATLLKQVGESSQERVQELLNVISHRKSKIEASKIRGRLKRVIENYERAKKEHNRWDFDDILMEFLIRLQSDRKATLEKIPRIEYLLVDEFQDTNEIQWEIMTHLRQYFQSNTFVVGDDDQSIYGFRGASPRWLLEFPQAVPNTVTHFLEDNFRSDKTIIEHACRVIQHNRNRTPKVIRVVSDRCGESKYYEWRNESAEARGVGQLIKNEAKSGQTIAVLARTRQQLLYIAEQLSGVKVTYSTYHQAKGREWDIVHLIGVTELNPYLRNDGQYDGEEERRLFYVALTRARHAVFVHQPRRMNHLRCHGSRFAEEAGFKGDHY